MPEYRVTVPPTGAKIVNYLAKRTTLLIACESGAAIWVSENPQNIQATGLKLAIGEKLALIKAWGDDPTLARYAMAEGTASAVVKVVEYYGGE